MGILCPVIHAFMRSMFDAGHDVVLCGAIGSQLVSDHDAGCISLSFQKLSHQAFGCLGIASVFPTANGDDDLIEVPLIAKLSG
jgi:hypothetical protein